MPINSRLEKKIKLSESGEKSFIGGGNFEKKILKAFGDKNYVQAKELLPNELRHASQKEALTTIYSAEALLGLGESTKACEIIGECSSRFFDNVQLICCVRPPLDHASSQYSEFVKRRRQTKALTDCMNDDIYLDLGARLKRFSKAIGTKNTTILPYEDPLGQSIVKRFFRLIDERVIADPHFLKKINNRP